MDDVESPSTFWSPHLLDAYDCKKDPYLTHCIAMLPWQDLPFDTHDCEDFQACALELELGNSVFGHPTRWYVTRSIASVLHFEVMSGKSKQQRTKGNVKVSYSDIQLGYNCKPIVFTCSLPAVQGQQNCSHHRQRHHLCPVSVVWQERLYSVSVRLLLGWQTRQTKLIVKWTLRSRWF